jgi:hypothetical protein
MSLLSPVIGAYWSARKEEREACAQRTLTLLEDLRNELQHPAWFPTTSRPERLKPPIELTAQSISSLLTTNNRDIDRIPIPELGFYLSIWNGDFKQPMGMSINCGLYSLRQSNCVVVNMPATASPSSEQIDRYGKMLGLMIKAWEPDFAVATTMQAISTFAPVAARSIKGWFIYDKGASMKRTPFGDA